MPTPRGLPKAGEVWERTMKLPPDWQPQTVRFRVIERGHGDYWSLRVRILEPTWLQPSRKLQVWVDAAYMFQRGELKFIEGGT